MADISKIKSTERTLEILHPGPNKEKIGIRVHLMSLDDDRMKTLERQIVDRRLHLEARGKNFKAEEIEDNKKNIGFKAMTGWEWYEQKEEKDKDGRVIVEAVEQPTFHDVIPEFNRKNVFDVFTELTWFHDQVMKEIGETEGFFAPSKPS